MSEARLGRRLALPVVCALLAGCAALAGGDAPRVSVAGFDALPAEGMELRFLVRLRVQNPRDTPLQIDGVALDLAVRGMGLASGVSPVRASVPRFGEAVVGVPVTVPATAVLRQAWSLVGGRELRRIEFELTGRLASGPFGGHRFASQGELDWPPGGAAAARP